MDRHTGRLRGTVPELHPCGGLNHLYETFLLVFLWLVILICLVHSPYLVYLRILPCCASTSLSPDGSYCKGIWIAWHQLTSLLFDLQGASPGMCDQEGLLTLGMRYMWSGQGPGFSLNCSGSLHLHLGVLVNRELISSCFTLGEGHLPPASFLCI